jgi:hypothetical protein
MSEKQPQTIERPHHPTPTHTRELGRSALPDLEKILQQSDFDNSHSEARISKKNEAMFEAKANFDDTMLVFVAEYTNGNKLVESHTFSPNDSKSTTKYKQDRLRESVRRIACANADLKDIVLLSPESIDKGHLAEDELATTIADIVGIVQLKNTNYEVVLQPSHKSQSPENYSTPQITVKFEKDGTQTFWHDSEQILFEG